jgi:FMN phosphatase YigB (HAD superfamily)
MPKLRKTSVITDLDNTLFDWVDLWVRCFGAMFEKIVEISGVPAEELKAEIKRIHRKHGTSEYSFLIEELPSIRQKFGRKSDLTKIFARVRRLGWDGVLTAIFCPQDHEMPKGLGPKQLRQYRKYPASHYKLKYSKQAHTPRGSTKPDHKVLDSIIRQLKLDKEQCIYVGDSLFKDVAMAQDCDVDDVWAKYGVAHKRAEYKLLQDVTHWTDKDVQREQEIKHRDVKPRFVLESSYSELLELFDFGDP